MEKNRPQRDALPLEFSSVEEAAQFWDTHDLTDYEDVWKDAEVQVRLNPKHVSIQLEPQIAQQVVVQSQAQHVSPDAFVNRILSEYLKKPSAG